MQRRIVVLAAVLALVAGERLVDAQTTLRIRETITLPDGYTALAGLADLDGDKRLDLVVYKGNQNGGFKILERAADGTWEEQFAYQAQVCRSVSVADADGDGRPEIALAELTSVVIYEATADNRYEVAHQSTNYGAKIERITVGDTDGDGRGEFLVAREGGEIVILETVADNTYQIAGPIKGKGGDCHVIGTCDLDGDGVPSLVFQDNERFGGKVGHTYIFKKRKRVFDQANFGVLGLGDTDGNGRQELIGGTNLGQFLDDLVIFECQGNSQYKKVVSLANWWDKTSRLDIVDLDGDGRTELLRRLPGPGGARNVLSIATRDGDEIKEVFNSGDLFVDQNADLGRPLPTADTNHDGHREFRIAQDGKLFTVEIERGWTLPSPRNTTGPGSGSGPVD